MADRGEYRQITVALVDDPAFQGLTAGGQLLFFHLKMTLGPSGIDVTPALVPTLAERTNLPTANIEKGLAELESKGWIKRERNVTWIVNGLKDDPSLNFASNHNHRTSLAKHLNGLPKLQIIVEFRTHYGLAEPPSDHPIEIPFLTPENGLKMPSKIPSKMPSNKASKSKERIEGEGKELHTAPNDAVSSSRAGRPTWFTPFADAWRAKYGGNMSAGKAVRALKSLVDDYGPDETLRRWAHYIAQTPAEYANAPKFAETWGRWDRLAMVVLTDRPRQLAATEMVLLP